VARPEKSPYLGYKTEVLSPPTQSGPPFWGSLEIATTEVVIIEVLAGARTGSDHARLRTLLLGVPRVPTA
jgi:hypothetical protein